MQKLLIVKNLIVSTRILSLIKIWLIIFDASVKNNVATLVLYICRRQDIAKTMYHTMNIMSTEAEPFVTRCGINYATQIQDVAHIIIIMDIILAAKCIFDTSIHPYQLHSITILKDLREFFNKNSINLISF